MCGIAGIVSFNAGPVLVEDVSAMCAAMVHRGPDDEGFHVGPRVGLGMRRLSIIDLATGHQPIANEDGTVWAILNGEIYNYRELRRFLECRGHVFRPATGSASSRSTTRSRAEGSSSPPSSRRSCSCPKSNGP